MLTHRFTRLLTGALDFVFPRECRLCHTHQELVEHVYLQGVHHGSIHSTRLLVARDQDIVELRHAPVCRFRGASFQIRRHYCPISFNSSVTGHRPSKIAEMSQLSRVPATGDEIFFEMVTKVSKIGFKIAVSTKVLTENFPGHRPRRNLTKF